MLQVIGLTPTHLVNSMKVIYIAHGPSTEDDPLGALYRSNPVRTEVEAEYFPDLNILKIKNLIIEDPQEGNQLGHWKRIDGISSSSIRNAILAMNSLKNDPTVGPNITPFLNSLRKNTREATLNQYVSIMQDVGRTAAVRRAAIEIIKLILIQELE